MQDAEGFVIYDDTPDGTSFGPLSVKDSPGVGVWVMDDLGFIWNDLLNPVQSETPVAPMIPSTVPIIYGPICGVKGVPTSIYVRNALTTRSDQNTIMGTLASLTVPEILTNNYELKFFPENIGPTAYLYFRSEFSDAIRSRLFVNCLSAPNPGSGGGAVLNIGDSIHNRQGAQLQKQYAEGWGYTPTFIGTLNGSIEAEDADNAEGPLGECREGWETGDFTYSITDRVTIVNPGEESGYLELDKVSKWRKNPFLRAATAGDSPSIVRNGMVFDAAFYQQRFSLAPPRVVSISLGTNNVRDRSIEEIYANAYSDLTLIVSQCMAAWPSAKIALSCPGTARDPTRDVLWETKYVPYLRAMIQVKKDLNNSNIIVFPVWVHMSQEAGYTITSPTVDPLTNTFTGAFGDTVHPRGSNRMQLHQAYAKLFSCIFANLI